MNIFFTILFFSAFTLFMILFYENKKKKGYLLKITPYKSRFDFKSFEKLVMGKRWAEARNLIDLEINKFNSIDKLEGYKNDVDNCEEIMTQLNSMEAKEVGDIVNDLIRQAELILKYGGDLAQKIIKKEYFLGMTPEHLVDSRGEPTKIETEVLKTKTKLIYIYGNKSSGDIFTFVNDELEKYVDR